MNILLIGDSHVRALGAALPLMESQGDRRLANVKSQTCFLGNGFFLSQSFFAEDGDAVRMANPAYAQRLDTLTGENALRKRPGQVLLLSMGFHTARVFRNPMWRRSVPWQLAATSKGEPVSSAVLDAIVDRDARYVVGFFKALAARQIPFVVVAAPPPRSKHGSIASGTPGEVVLEVDRTYRARIARTLKQIDRPCVLPPAEAFDDEGFLNPLFREGVPETDPHHANAAFGRLMMQRALDAAAALSS